MFSWFAVLTVALFYGIGSYPLYDADEGRNGEVAREMAETNDYVLPRLDTLPYLDKPIVYFAAAALAMEVLGPTETAARLPAFLFMTATALLTGWFAGKMWGVEERWIAAIMTMAMPLCLAFSRTVIFDSTLAFFVVLSIVAFRFAVESVSDVGVRTASTRRWSALAWASIAVGVLTKGPVAIALPLLVCVPYALWRRRGRALWSIGGLVLFVAIIAPWVIAVSQVVPDFLHYVLVTETAQRMATKALKRTGPPWYFIPYLIGGAFPWILVPLFGWRAVSGSAVPRFLGSSAVPSPGEPRNRGTEELVFLILWIAVPLIFFSISQSKRPQYILPLMPAVALLVTRMWRRVVASARDDDSDRVPGARGTAVVVGVVGVILIAAAFVVPILRHLKPELQHGARIAAFGIGLAALAGGVLAAVGNRSVRTVLIGLSIPVMAIPLCAAPMLRGIGQMRSTAALVRAAAPAITPETTIIGVGEYESSLPFYLRRRVEVASADGSELTSNYLIRHFDEWTRKPGSTLHHMSWFDETLKECCRPRLYMVRAGDKAHRAQLEAAGVPLLTSSDKIVCYGPYRGPRGGH